MPGAPGTRQISQERLTEPSRVLPLTASGRAGSSALRAKSLKTLERVKGIEPSFSMVILTFLRFLAD